MKRSLLFLLLIALLAPWAAQAQVELTVYDGTATSSTVPAYMGYFDDFSRSQFVIPADDLAEMNGGTISSIKFYTNNSNVPYTSVSTVDVFLMEVDYTTMTALEPKANGTIVYQGLLDVVTEGSGGSLTIEFSTPYTYGGGNLLVAIENTTDAGYKFIYFYGQSVTGAAWAGYNSSSLANVTGSVQNFIPKTTFTYTAGASDCDMPSSIAVSDITADGATVTWDGDGSAWNLRYKASSDADFTLVENLTATTYTLSHLDGNTTYSVGVQTVCTGSTSYFKSTSFTTENPCAAPTNFVASNITASSATLSWTAGYQETAWTVKYKKSSESSWDNATTVSVSGTPTTNLTGLDGLTTYNVRVFNCTGENDPYLSGNFTTAASFPYSQDFTGSGIPTGWAQYSGLLANVMTGTALTSTSYGWSNGTSNGVLDGNHLYANIYSTGCNKWIVTPAIPVESGARLTFDVAYTAYSGTAANPQTTGTDDKFVVLASTDNMATWTILRQWDNAGSEYVLNELTPTALHQIFDLADYAGQNVNVAFYAESTEGNADNNIHVDNVVFELTPSCEKPTGLAVNYTGGLTAEVSWTSDASSWNLLVNGTQINNVTENPYTLTNLSLATTYNVEVQANCSGSTSEWTTPVSFNTAMCLPEDQCEITFELTDSFGDGWNGNAIKVIDVATEIELGTFTISSGSSANYNLAVCDGSEIQFVWVSGTYANETSYVVKDHNGEVIVEGSGKGFETFNYTVDCTVPTCFPPSNFAASNITAHTAELSWTSDAGAWEIQIVEEDVIIPVTTNPYTIEGLREEHTYTLLIRTDCGEDDLSAWSREITIQTTEACPAPVVTVSDVTPNGATVSWTGDAESYTLRYGMPAEPDPTAPATIILTAHDVWGDGSGYQMLLDADATAYGDVFTATGGWTATSYEAFEYTIPEGAECSVDATHIVVDGSVSIQIPAGIYDWCITNPTPGDQIYIASSGGNVGGRQDDYEFQAGMTYEFVIRLDDNNQYDQTDVTTYSASDVVWTTLENVTSPVTLEGLTPETLYLVEVQADCGEDGTSEAGTSNFTTLAACAAPVELTAEATATGATLNWTGYQDSYNIQYRTPGFDGYYINETWDGEIDDWQVYNIVSGTAIYSEAGVDDTKAFAFHWGDPGQYLISPELSEGAGGSPLTFSYKAYSANYEESFFVMFMTDVDTFTTDTIRTEDTDWHDFEYVVPEGTVMFAIVCTSDDAYFLFIDNIAIYNADDIVEPGQWMTTTATTTTANLTGLTPETEYEWQVQGVCGTDETTEWVTDYFTTLEQTTLTQTVALSQGWNWFSTYVEIELSDLQTALTTALPGATSMDIKSAAGNDHYNGSRWRATNTFVWDVTRMFMINVPEACEIEFTGMPINPEEHPIIITPGEANWIGFPYSESVAYADALPLATDFQPVSGETIKSADGSLRYTGSRWRATNFTNFEPNKGYIYDSQADTERTFIFRNGSSKGVQRNGQKQLIKDLKPISKTTFEIRDKATGKVISNNPMAKCKKRK